jgi:hypothetical protein
VDATREEWRPIVGYEGSYAVSNMGRVQSLDRLDAAGRRWPGRLMRQSYLRDHAMVGLSRNGKSQIHYVHTLVLTAFLGARPDGMECCHNDGNPANNQLSNLRWDTRSANQMDTVFHGRHPNASKASCKNGHPFNKSNTYWVPDGSGRRCRTCRRDAVARRDERSRKKLKCNLY